MGSFEVTGLIFSHLKGTIPIIQWGQFSWVGYSRVLELHGSIVCIIVILILLYTEPDGNRFIN